MSLLDEWANYQARRQARKESRVKRVSVDLERTDVWKGTEVREHNVSDTQRSRILRLFGRK